jgi:hypothetical protein
LFLISIGCLDAYYDLNDALETQSLSSIVTGKIISTYQELEETVSKHISGAFNVKKGGNSDVDKLKSRFNFASINGGAKIIATRPSVKIGKSILDDNIDK